MRGLATIVFVAAAQVAAGPFLQWPRAPGDERYGAIDGKHLHALVVEQAEISRRYRDQGHPQFWGRITGTSSDAESAMWLVEKFKRIGLSDIRVQPIDLPPQWMPQSWTITATGANGKTLRLDRSARSSADRDATADRPAFPRSDTGGPPAAGPCRTGSRRSRSRN